MGDLEPGLPVVDMGVGKIERVDGGLGIRLKSAILYRGSGEADVERFSPAMEHTVGKGVYLTSNRDVAEGYATHRARNRNNGSPVVYETIVEDVKLLDLRDDGNVKELMEGFRQRVVKELERKDLSFGYQMNLLKSLELIGAGEVNGGNLADVAEGAGGLFDNYCKGLGYDGLVTIEGGEGGVGNHDSYVIYDPNKVRVKREVELDVD